MLFIIVVYFAALIATTGFSVFGIVHQGSIYEQASDEQILIFLKRNNLIGPNDVYMAYDRDIGLFGLEGPKRYIYEREDKSYYYVEISPMCYTAEGDYMGYVHKPYEIFYLVEIQNCAYDPEAKSVDVRITGRYGRKAYYIVSRVKGGFKLMPK